MDCFDYDKYITLVREMNDLWDNRAYGYKSQFIPDKVYKYGGFCSSHSDENIKALCEGKTWMPMAYTLNDPFEYHMFTFDLGETNNLAFRKDVLERNAILSFAPSCDQNLMWSHYGEGHSGYCLEFVVENDRRLYPVTYCRKQQDISEDIKKWLFIKPQVLNGEGEIKPEERVVLEKVNRIMYYKICDWEYERELRIVDRSDTENQIWEQKPGYWQKLSLLGLRLKRIILGFNCNLVNTARVMSIVSDANEKKLMNELSDTDYKYTVDSVYNSMNQMDEFVGVSVMRRDGDGFALEVSDYESYRGMYKLNPMI